LRTPGNPAPGTAVWAGVFLSNLSALVFEIVLTRIFSVTLWYHLAFMVVTAAMAGIGAGGLAAFFIAGRLRPSRVRALLGDIEAFKALAVVLFIVVYLAIPFVPGQMVKPTLASMPAFCGIFLLAALPFLMMGLLGGLVFSHYSASIGKIYAADLGGAGAGVLAAVGGLYLIPAPSLMLLAAAVSGAAAVALAPAGTSGARLRAGTVLLAAAALLVFNLSTGTIGVRFAKNYVEKKVYFEKWSPLARITVIRYPLLAWGLGGRYTGRLPKDNFLIEQDGAAGTPVVPAGEGADLAWLDWDVTSLGLAVVRPRSAVIIGAGGGKDILTAARAGVKRIVAVEINPDIVRVVEEEFAGISGRPYALPGVEKRVAEGRSFLAASRESYDFIQLAMVDSWAATSAGAFTMSENHLYTLEAFDTYLERLTAGGALSLSRYFTGFFPAETLRVFCLAAEALRRAGSSDPGAHLLLARSGNIGTLVVKKTPLGPEEEARAADEASRKGYGIVFSPSARGGADALFGRLAGPASPEALYAALPLDVTPPVDDRPFFFFVLKPGWWLLGGTGARIDEGAGLPQNVGAAILVRNVFLVATCFALLILLLPAVLRSRGAGRQRRPAAWLLYFAAIGSGFMAMEIPLIQKFILPLGHPVLATAVVLCTLLVSSGLGSFVWGSRPRLLAVVTGAAALIGLVYYAALEPAAGLMLPLPLWARAAAAAAAVAPAGFVMGGAFPAAMRLAGERHAEAIPWLWAVNGAFSVQSSVLAMLLSISLGFRPCFLAAAAAYLLALVVVVWKTSPFRGGFSLPRRAV